jgi:hypothetical protein
MTAAIDAAPAASEQKPRWFRLTPDRLVWALLATEVILWLSERCRLFVFSDEKGLAIILALAALGLVILWFSLWYLSALFHRRRFQFGIRTLLAITVAVAVPFSWLAVEINRAKREKEIVERLQERFEIETRQSYIASDGLKSILGEYFFTTVYFFCCTESRYVFSDEDLKQCCELGELKFADFSRSAITDASSENIGNLARLKYLDLRDTVITDVGLKHLEKLQSLESLDLTGTNTTEAGVEALQSKLPQCKIAW